MQPTSPLTPIKGDYSDIELRTIMASLIGCEPEQVCEVAAVIIFHQPGGVHQLTVITDQEDGATRAGATLSHAALHVYGKCKRCQKMRRKLGRPETDVCQ